MTELRTRMVREMTLRGFSPRTHKSYIGAVVHLAWYYGRSPDQLTDEEVQAYLLHLVQHRKLAWASCSLAVNAFRFLYHVTLGRDRTDFRVPAPKVPQKLPEILSRAEVWRLIDAASSPKHRLLLATTYAAGLRVSEVVALKVTDIDPERLTIRVEQGKGGKDRYVPLADRLLVELRRYWQVVPPARWVFPNRPGYFLMRAVTIDYAPVFPLLPPSSSVRPPPTPLSSPPPRRHGPPPRARPPSLPCAGRPATPTSTACPSFPPAPH